MQLGDAEGALTRGRGRGEELRLLRGYRSQIHSELRSEEGKSFGIPGDALEAGKGALMLLFWTAAFSVPKVYPFGNASTKWR